MNKIVLATIVGLLAAGAAVYDLLSEWLLRAGWIAFAVVVGLLVVAWVTLGLAVMAVIRDARRASTQPAPERARAAARGVTWSSLFAIVFSVLLFSNCASGISSGPNLTLGAMSDSHLFWSLAALFQTPLLIALAIPGALAAVAATTRRPTVATAVIVASVVAAVVAVLTVPLAFVLGVSNCDVGTVGGCAAGLGGLTNIFLASTLVLFLPYAIVLARAINAVRSAPPS